MLRRRARTAALATLFVIVLYALIVEHNAPILRAATMSILLCVAQLMRRPFCGLNWLAFSALCVLTYNPLELFRAGFQLSFVQVLALLTIVPHLYRFVIRRHPDAEIPADADSYAGLVARRLGRWLVGLAIVCISAWIISLPLVMFHFGRFAPWGALQSIIISPLVMVTIVLGFLTLIGLAIAPPLGQFFGLLLRGSTQLLLRFVEHLSQLPGTLIEMQRPPAVFVICAYACLLLLAWSWWPCDGERPARRHRRTRRIAGTFCALVAACTSACGLLLARVGSPDAVAVYVLSVGSGAATLVADPGSHAALFDVGTIHNFDAGQTAVQAARALGVHKLDLLAVSHANFDHYSGAATVLAGLPTQRLVTNPYLVRAADDEPAVRRFLQMLPECAPAFTVWQAGQHVPFGNVSLEVLWPPPDLGQCWEPNDRSLVIRLSAYGRSVMIPGDIEDAALRSLLERHADGQVDLRADVLIAPHHGAVVRGDTAAFYAAVRPQVVVNSSGRERPKLTAMLDALAGADVRLLSTHDAGAISIYLTTDGGIEIQTPFAAWTVQACDGRE